MTQASPVRYGAVAQTLHWLTAILVLAAFIYGLGGSEERIYSVSRDFDRQLHETLGISVMVLLVLRLLWRAFDARPPAPAGPRWMEKAAGLLQATLYALLAAVPLTAIAGAWLQGHPVTLLTGIEISPWIAESHGIGDWVAQIHTWLGDAILWLAGLHACAALFHHYVLRDGVLQSMLPRWVMKGQNQRKT
ncbi:MAG: cytochrome b [Marinobacter sp.]|nr:cytochrome b [Marinobacter sp.]